MAAEVTGCKTSGSMHGMRRGGRVDLPFEHRGGHPSRSCSSPAAKQFICPDDLEKSAIVAYRRRARFAEPPQ
jgi:hypothetical protein